MRHGRRTGRALAVCLTALALLTACTSQGSGDGSDGPSTPGVAGSAEPGTLRVLASSELSDMRPVLDRVREETGLTVRLTPIGTLDAVDLLAKGGTDGKYDAVWLSSNDSLRLRPEAAGRIVSETPVMASPVAIGVKDATARRLGWRPGSVTWSQVEQAVADGRLTYGMTDPARSNSGFATLVSVASALSGAQSALTDADVAKATPRLREFFTGQQLTSGSSGWLAAAYERRGNVDALLNYESVLLGIPGLTVIRPTDGVLTADYPLSTLASTDDSTRGDVRRLAEALRTPEIQREITRTTHRRPVLTSVPPAAGLD
ncbi:solute-binding protein, partial [Streptomyces sp. SID5914]